MLARRGTRGRISAGLLILINPMHAPAPHLTPLALCALELWLLWRRAFGGDLGSSTFIYGFIYLFTDLFYWSSRWSFREGVKG